MRRNQGPKKRDFNFYIKRTKHFLNLVGHPEKGMKYVHVTGTAGKGTVSTMMQEVLTASGQVTGLFTSPYVTTTIEKIKAGDLYISPEEFIELVEYVKPFIKKAEKSMYGAPSAFELFVVIALLYFKKKKCQWAVLEVGLGGRFDATNITERTEVTAITTIDYDHTEILGKTLNEIAYDKAGIIKKGSHFFTSEQRPALLNLFKKICREQKAHFSAIPRQKDYQDYNKELVRAMALHLKISHQDIEKGIARTRLPCRFEIMQDKPLVILDGAHNRAKVRSTLYNLKAYSYKKLHLVLAVADTTKDHDAVLKELVSCADSIILTQVKSSERRSVHPKQLLEKVKKYQKKGSNVEVIEDAHAALKKSLKISGANDVVLVTGSFFLAGELRKEWFSEEWVLRKRKSF